MHQASPTMIFSYEVLVSVILRVQPPVSSMLDDNSTFAGRYHIVRRLASGGMGAVYEARHVETGRPCALKVMLAHVAENATSRERFRLEARAAALVSSTHVVGVLDAGVDETTGSPFLVMELLRGEDLASRVARLGPLAPDEVALFVSQAARGLEALHRASIVHRDLKPSNLFLAEREGDAPVVKVLDLGVAKRVADTAATTAVVGTPLYMAPEQMSNGKISPATDEYALAMVAYSLLVGREYWAAEADRATSSIAFALTTLDGPKEPATARAAKLGITLPVGFDEWFVRAAAPDPEARFPSVIDAAISLCEAFGVDAMTLRADAGRRLSSRHPEKAHAPHFDAFTPTMLEDPADKPHAATVSLADGELRPISRGSEGLAETQVDALPQKTKWSRKKRFGASAALFLGAAVAGAFVFHQAKAPRLPPVINALDCAPAEMTGPSVAPRLVEVFGKAACARLGVEMGVAWLEPQGSRVHVRAELHDDRSARVTLEVADRNANGEGKTLIAATNAAIQNLVPLLQVPPMSPERIAGWGAQNEASARRIERAMRQKAFGFADRLTIAEKIVTTDGDSPISHAMLACALKRQDLTRAIGEKKEARKRLSLLPTKRAKLVDANLTGFIPTPDDPKKGVGPLDSYSELANDPDFATLFTMCGCMWSEATLPMVDWLHKHAPVMGLPIVPCTLEAEEASPERVDMYLAWMDAVLPEWNGKELGGLVRAGKMEEAREALVIREWLGDESTTHAEIASSNVLLAFASFQPRAAIAAAEALTGEPDLDMSHQGALQRIYALLFAGKIRAAGDVAGLEIVFLSRDKKYAELLDLAGDELRLRRLLGRPALMPKRTRIIDETMTKHSVYVWDRVRVELALLRSSAKTETVAKEGFAEILAEPLREMPPDRVNAYLVPKVRIREGNDAVVKMFRDIRLVSARRIAAFEAGLAFEAVGARTEAEEAYQLCTEQPWYFPFDAIAARVRLAEMARADGHEERARELTAIVDRAWADADPDLRDIVRQMK